MQNFLNFDSKPNITHLVRGPAAIDPGKLWQCDKSFEQSAVPLDYKPFLADMFCGIATNAMNSAFPHKRQARLEK